MGINDFLTIFIKGLKVPFLPLLSYVFLYIASALSYMLAAKTLRIWILHS